MWYTEPIYIILICSCWYCSLVQYTFDSIRHMHVYVPHIQISLFQHMV